MTKFIQKLSVSLAFLIICMIIAKVRIGVRIRLTLSSVGLLATAIFYGSEQRSQNVEKCKWSRGIITKLRGTERREESRRVQTLMSSVLVPPNTHSIACQKQPNSKTAG